MGGNITSVGVVGVEVYAVVVHLAIRVARWLVCGDVLNVERGNEVTGAIGSNEVEAGSQGECKCCALPERVHLELVTRVYCAERE